MACRMFVSGVCDEDELPVSDAIGHVVDRRPVSQSSLRIMCWATGPNGLRFTCNRHGKALTHGIRKQRAILV